MEKKLKELRVDPRITMFLLPILKGNAKEPEKPSSSSATTRQQTADQSGQEVSTEGGSSVEANFTICYSNVKVTGLSLTMFCTSASRLHLLGAIQVMLSVFDLRHQVYEGI